MDAFPSTADLLARITRGALWAPFAIVVGHILIGGWLGHEPYVDPVMHFLGGVAAAYFFWQSAVFAGSRVGSLTALGLGLMAFGLTSAMAVVWEFVEYLSDVYLSTSMQRGVPNTMRDLVLGLGGAAVFVATRWIFMPDQDRGGRA